MWQLLLFLEIETFPYYVVFSNTLNQSNDRQIILYPPISTQKGAKESYGTSMSILYSMGENLVIINISRARSILYYFVFTKTLNLSGERWKLV